MQHSESPRNHSSPKSLLKDVGALRLELQRKEEENRALQEAFDDYVGSSKELEDELESELEKAESSISELTAEKVRLAERCEAATVKTDSLSSFLAKVEVDLETLRAQHKTLKEQKWQLEQKNDDIEEKLRIVEASHDNVKHKLERAIEENVFLTSDLDELKRKSAETEERLRTEITDLNAELSVLRTKLETLQSGESQTSTQSTGEEASNEEEASLHSQNNGVGTEDSFKIDSNAELVILRERLVDLELKNEELSAELAGMDLGKAERLQVEIASVTNQKDSLEKNLEELIMTLESHESQNKLLEEQLLEAQKETTTQTASLETALNQAQEQSSELRTQLADAEAELKEKKCLLGNTQEKLKQLNTRLVEEASSQSELQTQITEMQECLEKEASRNLELESELTKISEEQRAEANAKGHQQLISEKERLEIRVKELENKLLYLKKRSLKRGSSMGVLPITPGGAGGLLSPMSADSPPAILSPRGRASSPGPLRRNQLDISSDDSGTLSFSDPSLEKQAIISGPTAQLKDQLKELQDKYEEQCLENAQLLRQIQQIKGNIQVCCRIRPPTAEEEAAGTKLVLDSLGEGEVGFWDRRNERWASYTFDRVWGWEKSQTMVYRDVAPVAIAVVDGFNACVFAYGQTGSGKTHTMIGPPSDPGVSERTVRQIFASLELKASQYNQIEVDDKNQQQNNNEDATASESEGSSTFEWSVRVAMMEIYNEELRDLLAPQSNNHTAAFGSTGERKSEAGALEIRRNSSGAHCEIPGLTYHTVTAMEEVLKVFEQGNSNRATASTDLNSHSSRSHSILTVEVTTCENDGLPKTGRLHLVDLAGSERVKNSNVAGKELKEAQYINRSLSALGDVMEALDQKQNHVPYRNSKLTYFLQDSIGGSSLTLMIVTLCPTEVSYEETNHALDFAWRVRHIQRQPVQRNIQTKNLQEKLKQARAELRQITKKKEHAEEALALAKREQKASAAKMAAILENRQRGIDEMTKTKETRIFELNSKYSTLNKRYETEKAAREKYQSEAEEHMRMAKRLEAQMSNLLRDNENMKARIGDREAELTVLKREIRTAKVNSRYAGQNTRSASQARGARSNHSNSIRQKFAKREAELSRSSNLMDSGSDQGSSRQPSRWRMSITSIPAPSSIGQLSRSSSKSTLIRSNSGRSQSDFGTDPERSRLKKTSSFTQQRQRSRSRGKDRRSLTPQLQGMQRRSMSMSVSHVGPVSSETSPRPSRSRMSSSSSQLSVSSHRSPARSSPSYKQGSYRKSLSPRNDSTASRTSSINSVELDTMSRAEQALQKHKSRMLARVQSNSNS